MILNEILDEFKLKDIERESLEIPTFIFLMGGTGSGKNYTYRKFFKNLPLIDLDIYTAEFAEEYGTDRSKQVSRATIKSKKNLLKAFDNRISIVQMGTGNNIKSTLNKFKWAKEAGMRVVLVLVDVEPKTASKRNLERHKKGEPRLVPDEKVIRTVKVAKENFKVFKNSGFVDEAIIIEN